MKKPIIGVTPLFDTKKESIWMLPGYTEVLSECGACPVILPFDRYSIDDMLDICDGFLFTGGHDVNPSLYFEDKLDVCGEIYNEEDELEKALFEKIYRNDIPLFGICRGIQLINVLLGGRLYQDIGAQIKSDINHTMKPPYDRQSHNVKIYRDTPLYKVMKTEEAGVNSYHHQGIKVLSDKLMPMAEAEDGIIEAVYCPDKKYIQAVQWHPELSWRKDRTQLDIMRDFVEKCK